MIARRILHLVLSRLEDCHVVPPTSILRASQDDSRHEGPCARVHRSQRHPRPGAPGPRGRRRACAGPGGARVHLREGGGEVASDIGGGMNAIDSRS